MSAHHSAAQVDPAVTVAVLALVSLSGLLLSSVNSTRTFSVAPRSAVTSV